MSGSWDDDAWGASSPSALSGTEASPPFSARPGMRLKDIPELNRDASNLKAVMAAVREVLQTFRGYRGNPLDEALTLRGAIDRGILTISGAYAGSGATGPAGPPGPVGPPGPDTTPDLTPPPTPEGLAVTAGLTHIYVSCDPQTYTQGHGHDLTVVYGAKWPGGAAPTFSDSVELFRFRGTFDAYPTDTGTTWCIWIKWQSVDGVLSVSPAGGTNGEQATTGVIGNVNLGPLIIEAGNLADGSVTATKVALLAIDATKFANGIEPVTIVAVVPGALVTKTIFNTGDGKLYRWNGSAYVATVPTTDLIGTITGAQIAAATIDASKLAIVIGGGNALSNSSFEVDSNADGLADGWTAYNIGTYGGASSTIDTANVAHGAKSQLRQATALGTATTDRIGVQQNLVLPDVVGKSVILSASMAASASAKVVVRVVFKDGASATISQFASTAAASATLSRKSVSAVVPAGTVTINCLAYATEHPTGGACDFNVDAMQFEFADLLTAYAPRPDEILAGSITATEIADNAITTPKIVAGAIVAGKIAANAISATEIQAGAVTTAKLVAGAVTANEISAGAVTTTKLAAGAVTANEIAANTITATEIAANAITASELAADSVTAGKIAASAISAREIAAGAITTSRLLVTGSRALNHDPNGIDDSAWSVFSGGANLVFVTGITDIPAGGSTALANAAGTKVTLVSELIPLDQTKNYLLRASLRQTVGSADKVFLGVHWYDAAGVHLDANVAQPTGAGSPAGWVAEGKDSRWKTSLSAPATWTEYTASFGPAETAQIPSNARYFALGAILNNDATAASVIQITGHAVVEKVGYNLVVDGAILANHLAANSIAVGTAAIQNGAIVNAMLGDATIDSAKIANLSAAKITAGTLDAARIAAGSLDASKITAGTITATQIASSTITAGKMNVSTLSAIVANMGAITSGTVTLDSAGHVKGGQTAYHTGTGFFLGYSGAAYKLSIGNPSGKYMTWDGSQLNINADTIAGTVTQPAFTASISGSGDLSVSVSNGEHGYGSRTITPSGGTAPYSYLWTLGDVLLGSGAGAKLYISNVTTATVSAGGNATNSSNDGVATCLVTDSQGRTCSAELTISGCHGSC